MRGLEVLGPVLAVGRPTERLPLPGAARLYAESTDWREAVAGLLADCSICVIRFGDMTEALQWEVKEVSRLQAARVVLLLPTDEPAYQSIRAGLGDLGTFPVPHWEELPEGRRRGQVQVLAAVFDASESNVFWTTYSRLGDDLASSDQ